MGQEIVTNKFSTRNFQEFQVRLKNETLRLGRWFEERRFAAEPPVGGFELEAWLIDKHCRPAPINEEFMSLAGDLLVTPELAKFNIELNSNPRALGGDCLVRMHRELIETYRQADDRARHLGARIVLIGILPTVREDELSLRNMSERRRYRALNEQILTRRGGQPIQLDIHGIEKLHVAHHDVMLEAAATAFQIHLQVTQANAVRIYNAARIISAPMVAVTANSPFLFGKNLWAETRIPLFEQAIAVRGIRTGNKPAPRRVSFGTGYAGQSLYECFMTNLGQYPVLLPAPLDEDERLLPHLRLHNGTIWRWNRPLIGFNGDGVPHLRIEHRPVAAGPTMSDTIANAAFYYGLIQYLETRNEPPERVLGFDQAEDNFYSAARYGLPAHVTWLDGKRVVLRDLVIERLIPQARIGLQRLDIDAVSIQEYLGIINGRVTSGRNGADWQRRWITGHGPDMPAMTANYLENQYTDVPVHEWPV